MNFRFLYVTYSPVLPESLFCQTSVFTSAGVFLKQLYFTPVLTLSLWVIFG